MSNVPLIDRGLDGGRYGARMARTAEDLAAAQALRAACFRRRAGGAVDADRFDPLCQHALIEDHRDGTLACTFRLRVFADGGALDDSYCADFYDLSALARYRAPLVELGRFCIRPDGADADILRVAWGMLAAIVDRAGAGMLIGCSSFPGTDSAPYEAGFALLAARHLAPEAWRPGRKAARIVPLQRGGAPPPASAAKVLPSLLRSYLGMGGRVSDHAVVDEAMGTLHVFTGLEVAAIPPARARALRALVG